MTSDRERMASSLRWLAGVCSVISCGAACDPDPSPGGAVKDVAARGVVPCEQERTQQRSSAADTPG